MFSSQPLQHNFLHSSLLFHLQANCFLNTHAHTKNTENKSCYNMTSMDAEKEKTHPEKSIANADDPKDDNQPTNHEQNGDPSEAPLSSEPSIDVNEDKPDNVEESSIPEIQEEPSTETEIENPEPEPEPLPPDLAKISEEIDEFISTLANSINNESSDPPDVPASVEQFSILIESKLDSYDSTKSQVKWSQLTDEDASTFLEAVERTSKLSSALSHFSSEDSYVHPINRVGHILQRAMSYLEEEFKSLLEEHKVPDLNQDNDSKSKESASSDPNQEEDQSSVPEPEPLEQSSFPGYPEETLSKLSRLAQSLIIGGHETECCQVYYIVRRNALEGSLHELGFEKHPIDEVQKMNWESLETEIGAWNTTFRQCASVHFSNERILASAIFNDYSSISESLFCNLSRGIILLLLNFSESVAMTKRAAEKLFKFLDVYETLRDLPLKMEDVFPTEFVNEIKSEASLSQGRLGDAIISIFCELENSIKADTGKTPVPGGAVHPLTRYIMNYLKYACEYKDTLDQIFREHKRIDRSDSASGSESENNNSQGQNHNDANGEQSPFQIQLTKVMDLLDSNLDTKSKLYRDISLSMIFLMNNGRYIVQKIRGSPEINSLLGDTWCRKRSSDVRQYHKNYQRETWGKLLNYLINHEGLNVNGKVVKPVLKERFKSFNAMFDEIYRTQTGWVIYDEQLQSELRVSISNMVVPAYRSFMARFGQHLTPGRQTEKYVKYQPEEIESHIDELFDGNSAPAGRWRI